VQCSFSVHLYATHAIHAALPGSCWLKYFTRVPTDQPPESGLREGLAYIINVKQLDCACPAFTVTHAPAYSGCNPAEMQGASHTFEPVLESSSLAATGSAGVTNIPPLSLDRVTGVKRAETELLSAVPPTTITHAYHANPAPSAPSSKVSSAGKAKAKDVLVEKSHGSFGKLNSMLHSFSAGKAAKSATVKKASTLSDAQVCSLRYPSSNEKVYSPYASGCCMQRASATLKAAKLLMTQHLWLSLYAVS